MTHVFMWTWSAYFSMLSNGKKYLEHVVQKALVVVLGQDAVLCFLQSHKKFVFSILMESYGGCLSCLQCLIAWTPKILSSTILYCHIWSNGFFMDQICEAQEDLLRKKLLKIYSLPLELVISSLVSISRFFPQACWQFVND